MQHSMSGATYYIKVVFTLPFPAVIAGHGPTAQVGRELRVAGRMNAVDWAQSAT